MDASMTSSSTASAAPGVASHVTIRTAIIYSTQRSPSEDELPWLDSLPVEPPSLEDLGPLKGAVQLYIAQPNCSTAFALDQQLWTHLAGNETHRWASHEDSQETGDVPLYAPLDEGRNEIRLLKVSRGIQDGGDTFQADLVRVSLDEDPAYLAISYAWGDPSSVGEFGSHRGSQWRSLPYSKGVFDIIHTILARGSTLYLWIDAVCINQTDLSERASQVAIMGMIYARARQVIAFIGEADEVSTTAVNFILRTINTIWAHIPLSDSTPVPILLANLLAEIGPVAWDWESIRGLVSRRWFRRFWVVQEIALGNDPVLVCGKHSLAWCVLKRFIDIIYTAIKSPALGNPSFPISRIFLDLPPYLQNATEMVEVREAQSSNKLRPPFFFTLSSLSVSFQSSDPRDRLYALLGLAVAKDFRDALTPNYEIKVEDLYAKLARQILMNERNISFLHMAGIGHHRSFSLPSWVPDWTSLPREIFRNMDFSGPPVQERPAGIRQPSFSFDQASPNVLTLYGTFSDSISLIVRDPFPYSASWETPSFYATAASYLDAVVELVHTIYPEDQCGIPHERPWLKPLMETLCATGSPLTDFRSRKVKEVDKLGRHSTPTLKAADFGEILGRLCRRSHDQDVIPLTTAEEFYFSKFLDQWPMRRRFYISSAGHFGLATEGARVGDHVCMFEGHRLPFIVRPVDESENSKGGHLVGEAVSSFCMPSAITEHTNLLHQHPFHSLLGISPKATA